MRPIFETLAPPNGYLHAGAAGAGHFVKMVHNGIEYGLMQAYAEGFELLDASKYDLDLHAHRRALEPGQRRPLVAPRARRARAGRRPAASSPSRVTSRTPARDAGPSSRRSTTMCRRLSLAHALFARFRSRKDDAFSAQDASQRCENSSAGTRGGCASDDRDPADVLPRIRRRIAPPSPARWSSSAHPATSPTACCCRRSTTSRSTGACRRVSQSSASRAPR